MVYNFSSNESVNELTQRLGSTENNEIRGWYCNIRKNLFKKMTLDIRPTCARVYLYHGYTSLYPRVELIDDNRDTGYGIFADTERECIEAYNSLIAHKIDLHRQAYEKEIAYLEGKYIK
jgi:hypothetical protein